MSIITFDVYGLPKGRPRTKSTHRNGRTWHYNPGTDATWLELVALAAKPHVPPKPFDCPISIEFKFFLPRPKRLTKKNPDRLIPHIVKPDVSNLVKGIEDILTNLGYWVDDSRIFDEHPQKWYAPVGGSVGVTVMINAWEDYEL